MLVCILAYGFFATRYTYHIDSLVSDYYDSDLLISAGRFVAPLLNYVTNWMAFSPFWQTVMLCILLVIAGLVNAVLIKRESKNKISDGTLLVFVMAFVSEPLVTGQLTYPNLNIWLSFVLVPLSLWVINPFKNISLKKIIAGILILTPAIDMYESFAPVFLVTVFFLFLIRFYFGFDRDKSNKEYFIFVFKKAVCLISILAVAIVLDFLISKILCKLFTGSFEFWYNGNTTTHWMDTTSKFTTSLKKLFCYFVVDIVLYPTQYFWAFLYTCSLIFIGITTVIIAIKNVKYNGWFKTVSGILFFVGMIIASKSLDLILCRPAYTTQMQPVQIFTAFAFLMFVFYVNKSKLRTVKNIGTVFIVLVILLQTQTINNFAVKNQERFEYEDDIITSVCDDLIEMDIQNKSVCLYSPDDYSMPLAFDYESSTNPVAKKFKDIVFSIWDSTIPDSFMDYLNRYFSGLGEFNTAEDCLKLRNRKDRTESPYLEWLSRASVVENTFKRKGLAITAAECDEEKLADYYENTEFEKGEKYRIIEDEEYIYVVFVTPDF